jgi:hypothetical protein
VKKKIQREGSKCIETACYLDEQRTGGERRVVAACRCTLLDWWLLSYFSGRRKNESLACYLGYGEKREGLLVLGLDFSSYY